MAKTEQFNLGFLQVDLDKEDLFLSVTDGFEHGPGIQRDGITSPKMTDPHIVPRIQNRYQLKNYQLDNHTTDPYVQRAGTWTIYHHIKKFIEKMGDEWTIVAVQSNGDLTMNHWHTAYIGNSHILQQNGEICALLTDSDPKEPVTSRIYRSLVKWRKDVAQIRNRSYECLNLRIESKPQGHAIKISEPEIAEKYSNYFEQLDSYNNTTKDIAPLVEFTLSGKP
ncbi:MAG: hypothetical protein ABIJ12_04310, partial [bacterium]